MSTENLKAMGIVVRALRSLTEIQGPTPQQILSYISTQYNIPKEKVKQQLGSILKRCREFGILRKTCGHQKVNPKKVQIVTEKRPCCDCKDCQGNCGHCKKEDNSEKKGQNCDKPKQKMCRSSKPKRDGCKRKKKRKRDMCKKKNKQKQKMRKSTCKKSKTNKSVRKKPKKKC